MDDQDRIDQILQRASRRLICSQCHRHFRPRDLALVEAWEERWLVRGDCAMCRANLLLSARLQDEALHIVPLDITPDEWPRFRKHAAITVEDVLTITRTMQAYEGDLSEILEDPLDGEGPEAGE